MEGTHPYEGGPAAGDVLPVYEYGHDRGCSVTGGHAYRGGSMPELRGVYLFGDFCEGVVRGIRLDGAGALVEEAALGVSVPQLTSFGEDASGRLYALSLAGGVYRLTP